jgi:dipeptidyl aminopeptidase/acylaminoacyl peptidase
MSGVTLRAGREPSCPALASAAAVSGEIVFAASHAMCIADLEARSVQLVYASPTEVNKTLHSVRWSPNGQTIAAIRERRPPQGQITREMVLISVDGTTVTPRATPDEFGIVDSLHWAADGERLVVAANDPGCGACARLYLARVGGGDWSPIPLPPEVIDVRFPSMSPTGGRILVGAATSFDAVYGAAGLLILEGDGRVVSWVATDAHFLSPAGWSSDGERIAFGRRFSRGTDIYLARGDGTLPGRLTTTADAGEQSVSTTHPVWSPDGRSLAVSVYASNELPHAISIVPVGGGPAVLLIEGASDFDWKP